MYYSWIFTKIYVFSIYKVICAFRTWIKSFLFLSFFIFTASWPKVFTIFSVTIIHKKHKDIHDDKNTMTIQREFDVLCHILRSAGRACFS